MAPPPLAPTNPGVRRTAVTMASPAAGAKTGSSPPTRRMVTSTVDSSDKVRSAEESLKRPFTPGFIVHGTNSNSCPGSKSTVRQTSAESVKVSAPTNASLDGTDFAILHPPVDNTYTPAGCGFPPTGSICSRAIITCRRSGVKAGWGCSGGCDTFPPSRCRV